MTREERIAAQRQAEKSARRHREYVDKTRAQRTEERAAQQRSADRRQELLNNLREQLVARRAAEKAAPSPPKEIARTERTSRGQPAGKPNAERKALGRAGGGHKPPRTGRASGEKKSRPFERPSHGTPAGEASRPDKPDRPALTKNTPSRRTGEKQSSRVRAGNDRKPLQPRNLPSPAPDFRAHGNRARAGRTELRQAAAVGRVRQHRELRAAKHASVTGKQEQRRQQAKSRSADRGEFLNLRAQRNQIRQALRARNVEAHRELRATTNAATQKSSQLRKAAATGRAEDRRRRVALQAQARTAVRAANAATSQYQVPADSLSWLSTEQGFVVDQNGNAVALRGVTVEGLDSVAPAPGQSILDELSLDAANISALVDWWGINLVRIPFQPSTILSGVGSVSSADLLQGLDETISALAGANVYTLLALRIPPADGATETPLPDPEVFDCWNLLAQRYEEAPGVLFEIYASAIPIQDGWLAAAPVLIGSIRQQHPASLLFVANGSGGADASGLPLRFTTGDPIPNLVYTARVASVDDLSFSSENSVGKLARSFPVCAIDWSAVARSNINRGPEAAANLFGRDGLGWGAASWNAEPRLVRDSSAHNFVPTRWGNAVQRAMLLPVRRPFEKLLPHQRKLV